MPTRTSLANTIRRLGLRTGIRLHEMASRVQVLVSNESDIEHGRYTLSDEVFRKIADQLSEVGGRYEVIELLKPHLAVPVRPLDEEARNLGATPCHHLLPTSYVP